jgi:DNA repair protein RecO (recombination protein O)
MSEERAMGVILRTRLLTESSLIVQWLTADAGRISTVARGARGAKSPFRGKLDLFHEAAFTFRRSSRSDLHVLREVEVTGRADGLRSDWRRLAQAAYGVALVELTTEEDTPLPEIWELFRGYLATVDAGAWSALSVYAFELRLLGELGQLPDFERESLPAGSRRLAERLMDAEWGVWRGREVAPAVVGPLERFLHGFLIFHLGRLPKGRDDAVCAGEGSGRAG